MHQPVRLDVDWWWQWQRSRVKDHEWTQAASLVLNQSVYWPFPKKTTPTDHVISTTKYTIAHPPSHSTLTSQEVQHSWRATTSRCYCLYKISADMNSGVDLMIIQCDQWSPKDQRHITSVLLLGSTSNQAGKQAHDGKEATATRVQQPRPILVLWFSPIRSCR